MATPNIEENILKWLSGDESVFGEVLDYYYPRLLNLALKMVSNREDAEELVMNVLLKIWQHKRKMGEVENFENYLFGILRREAASLFRKKVLPTEPIEDQPLLKLGSIVHPEFTLKELQAKYIVALQKLTPTQRMVFLSIREQEQSRKEVSEKTGMSLNTVNSHMNSAMQVLRREMVECPDALIVLVIASTIIQTV
ncbi:MAG: RNA polymerase sigma factor [Flavobacteriales bacterium]|nr:MAG: RNA polymerase sigma factor [Flavobacteriales bacterium]